MKPVSITVYVERLDNGTFLVTHGERTYAEGGERAAFLTLKEAEDSAVLAVREAINVSSAAEGSTKK